MSHFVVGVIVPKMPHGEISSHIDTLLAPYSEHLEVEPYDKECWCVNSEARQYGTQMANQLVGNIQERRNLFSEMQIVIDLRKLQRETLLVKDWETYEVYEDQLNDQWKAFNADYFKAWEETCDTYEQSHPMHLKPNLQCESCNGTGVYESTYNPQSKWDWYRVGGRWDGDLIGNPQESENGFNFDKRHETISNNSLPIDELVSRHKQTGEVFSFFAVVTPEGEWIEKGTMGWWGIVTDEKTASTWEQQLLTIYARYADHDIVALDCHI